MLIVFKNEGKVDIEEKDLTFVSKAYETEKLMAEVVFPEGDEHIPQDKIKNRIVKLASGHAPFIMEIEHPEDAHDSLKHSGLYRNGSTVTAVLGTYTKSLADIVRALPPDYGMYVGVKRLIKKKIYSNDALAIFQPQFKQTTLMGAKVENSINGLFYVIVEQRTFTTSKTIYCAIHRKTLTRGDSYYTITNGPHWKGESISGAVGYSEIHICEKCMLGLRMGKLRKMLKEEVW